MVQVKLAPPDKALDPVSVPVSEVVEALMKIPVASSYVALYGRIDDLLSSQGRN